MNQPLDKNGVAIKPGMKVRPCATHQDYLEPRTYLIRPIPSVDDPSLWNGHALMCQLSEYRNGDTNYHSVEIV